MIDDCKNESKSSICVHVCENECQEQCFVFQFVCCFFPTLNEMMKSIH